MASFWSTYLKDKVLNDFRGISAFTYPGTSYFALMTAAPTPLGGGTEVTIASRLTVPNNATNWNASSAGVSTNKLDFGFIGGAGAGADAGTIVGIAEYDASTGGNLLTYGDLTSPKTVLAGMTFIVSAGSAQFTYIDDIAP